MNSLKIIVDYIKNTRIENCDVRLQEHVKKCFLDIVMVTCCGTRNVSSKKIADYAETVLSGNEATILCTGKKSSLLGATLANAAAANALDMDDGYSITKGHPGAGIISGILAAAEKTDCTYGDVLSALLVGYEISMRHGICLQDYYNFYHSTGSYAGVGTAVAIAKLFNLTDDEIANAMGIADYYGPLVPCMRTVRVPSLNKDGIYLGSKLGVEAVLLAQYGVDGKAHILTDEAYADYVVSLNSKNYVYDLYFKFFSCCRWAQGALTALINLTQNNKIIPNEIEKILVYSYGASGELYSGIPENEMEAQYNMRYPIAVFLISGDCGPIQSSINIDTSESVQDLMSKILFVQDSEYEEMFPVKRYTRVEILLKDGKLLQSDVTEPLGEPKSNVSMQDIIEKAIKINSLYVDRNRVEKVVNAIVSANYEDSFVSVYEMVKDIALAKKEDTND